MTTNSQKIELLPQRGRRRSWSVTEKLAIVHESYEPGVVVSAVARRHGIAPNQLFTWRRLVSHGTLTETTAEEQIVSAVNYRILQNQLKELRHLLSKKTVESEMLKDALRRHYRLVIGPYGRIRLES